MEYGERQQLPPPSCVGRSAFPEESPLAAPRSGWWDEGLEWGLRMPVRRRPIARGAARTRCTNPRNVSMSSCPVCPAHVRIPSTEQALVAVMSASSSRARRGQVDVYRVSPPAAPAASRWRSAIVTNRSPLLARCRRHPQTTLHPNRANQSAGPRNPPHCGSGRRGWPSSSVVTPLGSANLSCAHLGRPPHDTSAPRDDILSRNPCHGRRGAAHQDRSSPPPDKQTASVTCRPAR